MERITRFYRGYDCINFECINDSNRCSPGAGGSHGMHGLDIVFYVNGLKGAVYFTLFTGWTPQDTQIIHYSNNLGVTPAKLGYISKEPIFNHQEIKKEKIDFLDINGYYEDFSGSNSKDAYFTLVNGGDDALWNFLEQYYRYTFLEGFDYPDVVKYPKKKRKLNNSKHLAKKNEM